MREGKKGWGGLTVVRHAIERSPSSISISVASFASVERPARAVGGRTRSILILPSRVRKLIEVLLPSGALVLPCHLLPPSPATTDWELEDTFPLFTPRLLLLLATRRGEGEERVRRRREEEVQLGDIR